MTEEEFITTAKTIRELFPKGIKSGTNKPWRISCAAIIYRLKKLEKYFNITLNGNDVIHATQQYVNTYCENNMYMKTLEYFIYKQYNSDGKIEIRSDLLTFIDMLEDGNINTNQNWIINLK